MIYPYRASSFPSATELFLVYLAYEYELYKHPAVADIWQGIKAAAVHFAQNYLIY